MPATARFMDRLKGVKPSGFLISVQGFPRRVVRHDGAVHARNDPYHDRFGHAVPAPYSAHRALEFHPVLKHFFRFWLWLTTACSRRNGPRSTASTTSSAKPRKIRTARRSAASRKCCWRRRRAVPRPRRKTGDAREVRQRHARRLDRAQRLQQVHASAASVADARHRLRAVRRRRALRSGRSR